MSTPLILQNKANLKIEPREKPLIFGGGTSQSTQPVQTYEYNPETNNPFGLNPTIYGAVNPIPNVPAIFTAPIKIPAPKVQAEGTPTVTPSYMRNVADQQATLTQGKNVRPAIPSLWDRLTTIIEVLFGETEESKLYGTAATQQNAIAISERTGIPVDILKKPGGSFFKNSVMESVTKELGIRNTPTNSEIAQGFMTPAVALGLITAPVPTAVAMGIWAGVSKVKSGLISAVKGEGFKPSSDYNISDLYTGESQSVVALLDTIDFLATSAVTAGAFKKSPDLFRQMTKDVINKYKLPETVTVTPKMMSDFQNGFPTEYADFLKTLPTEDRVAIAKGLTAKYELPAEDLTYVADKPYWGKIKEMFGGEPTNKVLNKEVLGAPKQTPSGLLEGGKTPTEPVKPSKTVPKVDVRGSGIKVYHGTGANFNAFEDSMRGSITGAKSAKGAIWFTDDPATAKAYAVYAAEEGPIKSLQNQMDVAEKKAQKSGLDSDWRKYEELVSKQEDIASYDKTFERRTNAIVKQVRIGNGNFLTVDAKGKSPQELTKDEDIDSWLNAQLDKARAQGKDGVKFINLNDAVGLSGRPSTHYAVFDSKNIKIEETLKHTDITGEGKIIKAPKPKVVSVPREQLPVGEGETKVSRLEARMAGALKGMSEEDIKALGTTTYNEMNLKPKRLEAAKYVLDNPEEAVKTLTGEVPVPKGLNQGLIYHALTNMDNPGFELATKVSTLNFTSMGQNLVALRDINPNSVVKVMADRYKIKEAEFKKQHGEKEVKQVVKDKVAKSIKNFKPPKILDWEELIKEVRCP